MSCTWTEKLSQLIDGELPEIEARTMQQHLNNCRECQLARTDFLRFRSEIASYVPSIAAAAQSGALNRILGKQQKPALRLVTARPRWNWSLNPRLGAFATIILLAAIVGFIIYRSAQNQQTAPPETAGGTQTPVVPNQQVSPQNSEPREERQASTGGSTESNRVVPKQKRAPRESRNLVAKQVRRSTDTTPASEQVVATDLQSLTAMHLQSAELLLRGFRNVRTAKTGSPAEIAYERTQARQLILRNMVLWREADEAGEIEVATLLENLEPILLDIANLSDEVSADDIRVINERVERKNIVALLQVNSTVLARALED